MDHSNTLSILSEALNIPSQLSIQATSSVAPSIPADRTRNQPQRKRLLSTIPALGPYKNISVLLVLMT